MTILLARHAQSPENLHGKGALGTLPQREIPLSDEGRRQALAMGEKLSQWCTEHAVSKLRLFASPYRRVTETAQIIEIIIATHVTAVNRTDIESLSEVDFLPRGSELVAGRILFGNRALAEESVAEIERRLHGVIEKIRNDEKEERAVLVLTHSTVMRGLATLLSGRALSGLGNFPRPDNCTLWQIDGTAAPVCIFDGFAPPARIAAPEDKSGTRSLNAVRKEKDE